MEAVVGIVNFEILPLHTPFKKHTNYSLLFDGNEYSNPVYNNNYPQRVQVINFTLPIQTVNKRIRIHIKDNVYNIDYIFNSTVLRKPRIKRNVMSCAYISDYNSVNEIRSSFANKGVYK